MDKNTLQKYKALLAKHKVSFKAIDWYIKWLLDFEVTFSEIPLEERLKDQTQSFIDSLVKTNKFKDWQINQANHALCIFYKEYLKASWAEPWPMVIDQLLSDNATIYNNKFKDDINVKKLKSHHPDLVEKIITTLRTLHYSYNTEQSYLEWISRYINFNDFKNPGQLTAEDIKSYLEYLARIRKISSNTQRQALNAIVFLYKKVLEIPIGEIGYYEKPKLAKRIPVVLTKNEKDKIYSCT